METDRFVLKKTSFRGMFGYFQSGPFSDGHTIYPPWSQFLAQSQSHTRRLFYGKVFLYVTISYLTENTVCFHHKEQQVKVFFN